MEEIETFVNAQEVLKLNSEDVNDLNKHIMNNDSTVMFKSLAHNKSLGSDGITGDSTKLLRTTES